MRHVVMMMTYYFLCPKNYKLERPIPICLTDCRSSSELAAIFVA